MNICNGCKFADWKMSGERLHNSGDGRCKYRFEMPPIPASMYWIGFGNAAPRPTGGYINRREKEPTECPVFESG